MYLEDLPSYPQQFQFEQSFFVFLREQTQEDRRSKIEEEEIRKMEEARREEEKKVMIAIDESDSSETALEWALSYLKPNLAGGVILFTVIPLDYSAVFAGTYGTAAPVDITPELVTCIQEKQKKSAIGLLNKAKNLCANHGVDAECLYKFGNAREAICDAVDKYQVGMLVLGSHGKGAIKRVFLGSVSNYCVNNAKCPVLVVRKPTA